MSVLFLHPGKAAPAESLQTINDFKEGKHYIRVSIPIVEEGLDIGQVDFVMIYSMPKQSIELVSPAPNDNCQGISVDLS